MTDLSFRYPNPLDQNTMRPKDHEDRISALERLLSERQWNSSWGEVGYAEITADQSGFGVLADVVGLSVTFTAVASRKYKVTAFMRVIKEVSAGSILIQIADGANVGIQHDVVSLQPGEGDSCTPVKRVVPGAGSVTYKVRASNAGTAGTTMVRGSSTAPGIILVEDVGPA